MPLLAVLDLIEVPERDLGFIVQEEWSSGLNRTTPSSLRGLLRAFRQCIEVSHMLLFHELFIPSSIFISFSVRCDDSIVLNIVFPLYRDSSLCMTTVSHTSTSH